MSFHNKLTQNIDPQKQKVHNERKEKDSLVIHRKERASAFTSKGSLTLEAAIVVPIFFFAILCIAYMFEITAIQISMRTALCAVGKEAARQAYTGVYFTSDELNERIVEQIGRERLERSVVFGGANGIDSSKTMCYRGTGVIDLNVQYKVEIPIVMFRIAPISCEEHLRVKGWTGYVPTGQYTDGNEMVYVTETGIVYHKDSTCTYLDMSVRSVFLKEIGEMRNQSGGKYYACESCAQKEDDVNICYITDYGTRYHKSLQCKKIKRNIYAIPIDETYGLGGCSKCVK